MALLFAGVRGSTAQTEKTSAMDFSRLINGFYSTATDVLVNSRSWSDRLVGDELFGIYVPDFAGSDHTRRAVEAGQALLKADRYGAPGGARLPVGVVVHTGVALAGRAGRPAAAVDMTALGDTVNVAARLASKAGAGEGFIREAAYRAAGLDLGSLERLALALKGKTDTVSMCISGLRRDGGISSVLPGELNLSAAHEYGQQPIPPRHTYHARMEPTTMDVVEQALQKQLKNIQAKTGKTLDQLYALIRKSGLAKHGEIRDTLKHDLGLGHGDANTLAKFYLQQSAGAIAAGGPTSAADPLAEIYAGSQAGLRPIHDKLMAAIYKFGPFEISPKKTYLSLRRKKQFAMLGPGTRGRVEVGLNMKGVPGTARLVDQPAGGMCQCKVFVSDAKEVDKELIGWIRQAFDSAG
jgi:class 3 adenylate cyclase